MPKKELFTNQEVMLRALQSVKWKSDLARKHIGQNSKTQDELYDTRNLTPLAAIIIDVSEYPENEREARYIEELHKLAAAFNTVDPQTKRPYPERVKPYIEKMYECIPTDLDSIDWDNEKQVESLICTLPLDQAISTMVLDFKMECLEIFSDKRNISILDATVSKMHYNFKRLDVALREKLEDITEYLNITEANSDSLQSKIEVMFGDRLASATLDGTESMTIDPEEHQVLMDCFLEEPFSISELLDARTNTYVEFDNAECERACMYEVANAFLRAPAEQAMLDVVIRGKDEFDSHSLLFINGKSVESIIAETANNEGISRYQASAKTATLFRNALTDGKSVVSLMRASYDKDGNASFRHQDIKVDLDKLNKEYIDRKYKSTNFIRRFLHDYGIWKIGNKFPTNEARDKALAATKENPELKNSLRAAEKDLVESYNSLGTDRHKHNSTYIMNIFPTLRHPEDKPENLDRESIQISNLDGDPKDIKIQPRVDTTITKTVSLEK